MSDGGDWLRIEIRHLAALAAVARESSFSGAADGLGYVPSAVAQQIGFLERVVGDRLVERAGRPRSSSLTEAGAVLVGHAGDILARLRAAKEEIDAIAHDVPRPPALGVSSTLAGRAAGQLLVAATGAAGWSRLERAPAPGVLAAVARGDLDAALVELPVAGGPFFAVEMLREPYALAVPRGARDADPTDALARRPLVALDACRATDAVRAAHSAPASPYRAATAAGALAFVRAGVAVAVLPEGDVPPRDDGVRLLALPGVPPRVAGLAWHRDRDDCPAVRALRAAAASAAACRPLRR
jgi:DNA-binding transcriptional LysR family regulator